MKYSVFRPWRLRSNSGINLASSPNPLSLSPWVPGQRIRLLHFEECTAFADQSVGPDDDPLFLIAHHTADPVGLPAVTPDDLFKGLRILFGDDGAEADAHVEDPEHLLIGDISRFLDQGEYGRNRRESVNDIPDCLRRRLQSQQVEQSVARRS